MAQVVDEEFFCEVSLQWVNIRQRQKIKEILS